MSAVVGIELVKTSLVPSAAGVADGKTLGGCPAHRQTRFLIRLMVLVAVLVGDATGCTRNRVGGLCELCSSWQVFNI